MRRRPGRALLTALALVCAFGLGFGPRGARAQPGGDPVKAAHVLRVGLEGTYPPFNYQDASGHLTGFEVDLANALAAKMGVRVQFQPAPFAGLLAALETGRSDVVINQVTITEDRRKKYAFTEP